jgi:putative phosphoribosyl transferase
MSATIKLPFENRNEAGRLLAQALHAYHGKNPLVLAIPRGAVPMARLIAESLDGELDVVMVRKLGAPGHEEFAIGAIDEAGSITLSDYGERAFAQSPYLREIASRELEKMRVRRTLYGERTRKTIAGRIAIVVDDGLATGATMIAALRAVRAQQPSRLICAVPVAAQDSLTLVSAYCDEIVCLATPVPFFAVGAFYRDFATVEDDEVAACLRQFDRETDGTTRSGRRHGQ